ncbi:alkaline phosphatase family protein [Sphingomonas sp.]|uniref:alkaline phosphatase family protein n=1 Tax=Sphingomonas sp. TaxID=28214 RepID=UPI002C459B80|nr:alkaline phosphatase family protein [Sphingomonas sp.]HTG38397.1 alkaline phosphatase family protein [Sphingomonas sp.]
MSRTLARAAALLSVSATPLAAQEAPATTPPKLIVMVSSDQFSTDLFTQYRPYFTGGLKRLSQGVAFPNGYQSHAATETCPGHATLMTGSRPARTGIVANNWYDFKGPRPGEVYCAEDERRGTFRDYVPSDVHLRVPTLGERLKARDPRTRTVSVAGKDRAAIMMGGHAMDQIWFWRDGTGFVTTTTPTPPAAVTRINAAVRSEIAAPAPALDLPQWCRDFANPVTVGEARMGDGRFERDAGEESRWKASPRFDDAVTRLAVALVEDMKLGRGPATDVLTVGLSATDYVGHRYGTGGSEMCIQVAAVDRAVGELMTALDATGVDYVIAFSSDHGGNDLPEREQQRGVPAAARVDVALAPAALGRTLAPDLGWTGGQLLYGSLNGDVWVAPEVTDPAMRARVIEAAAAAYRGHPQVASVLTADDVRATPMPTTLPDSWTLIERQRAAYDAERSGDFVVFLKSGITPSQGGATHGSPWDYDRRVPILFWRRGLSHFEQPLAVETIDIMPSFAALVDLPLKPGEVDGRCLDLDGGAGDSCAGD